MIYAIINKPTPYSQDCVLRINDNGSHTVIACVSESTDYQQYLAWLEEGNTPLPADE